MKKKSLIALIVGIFIQGIGIGFMLYGINSNERFTWIGFGIMSIGLIVIAIGLIVNGIEDSKKE